MLGIQTSKLISCYDVNITCCWNCKFTFLLLSGKNCNGELFSLCKLSLFFELVEITSGSAADFNFNDSKRSTDNGLSGLWYFSIEFGHIYQGKVKKLFDFIHLLQMIQQFQIFQDAQNGWQLLHDVQNFIGMNELYLFWCVHHRIIKT